MLDNDDEAAIVHLSGVSRSLNSSSSEVSNHHNNGNKLSASSSNVGAGKKKRQRTSPEQLSILEQIFETDKMPSQQIRIRLANQLGMSSRRVQIWFQNKRAKVKRGVFTKGDDEDDFQDQLDDDEEINDNEESGTGLLIDESSSASHNVQSLSMSTPMPIPSFISTSTTATSAPSNINTPTHSGNRSLLSMSTDNIVPSISPMMTSVSANKKQQQSMMSHFTIAGLGKSSNNNHKRSKSSSGATSPTQSLSSTTSPLSLSPIPFSPLNASQTHLPPMPMINLSTSSSKIPQTTTTSPVVAPLTLKPYMAILSLDQSN
ncbi:hypothetical protein SAMD00019534_033470 [Acytostelium subglobosum LB1]|uniref:hypothetical protein n=1 Tax=Acytostelium subglobosum LB1 TaxID=1410327 RepID=UPI000644F32F|nr:hypothetical protein SAMD00019534_033470 [Acytostelium subglobosum LB1]GAM20172.1 hypothetical protein SAMD00019534_033470 [Acytostelium subglobosum LB1]|eukprot:XP_012759693.1 hypothetical protein SAMD00019534_033470 [Acytostelium subglobosum LB1]